MDYKIPTFLKWAGGKRRILETLEPLFPKSIDRYFEPFLGGGSVFFFVKQKYNPSFSMISDINQDLVSAYSDVRDRSNELLKSLQFYRKNDSEDFYYKTRKDFNSGRLNGLKRSAAFIYMNKTCYSGLFRVNSKNEFNVPYGKYKNATIYSEKDILLASKLLQGVKIIHQDYRKISPLIKREDFIYLDPCYDPLKKTSFVQYTPEKFSETDRDDLSRFVMGAKKDGARILLSNNDIPEMKVLYKTFNFHHILAPRSLGSRVGADKEILELALRNFQ